MEYSSTLEAPYAVFPLCTFPWMKLYPDFIANQLLDIIILYYLLHITYSNTWSQI